MRRCLDPMLLAVSVHVNGRGLLGPEVNIIVRNEVARTVDYNAASNELHSLQVVRPVSMDHIAFRVIDDQAREPTERLLHISRIIFLPMHTENY